MAETKACDECGGKMIEVPLAGHDERPALIRDNSGKFYSKDALVHLERAHACLECGFVRLYVDPNNLRRRAFKTGA